MLNDLLSLFYPNNCVCCNHHLKKGENLICTFCLLELPRTNYIKAKDNPVSKLFWGRIELSYGFSTFQFNKKGMLKDIIHPLKYKSKTDLGIFLGIEMGKEIKQHLPPNSFDFIIPVPLHPKKESIRGYNQCDFIAKGISQVTNIPTKTKLIQRAIHTDSQTRKNKYERWQNVTSIFESKHSDNIQGKSFLVIDDVITTGATLESCAQTLLDLGAKSVSIAVAASGF